MEPEITKSKESITTIKLSHKTKTRLDHLKVYKRETYEETLQRMLEILNVCRFNPENAQRRLMIIEKEKKRNLKDFGRAEQKIKNEVQVNE